VINSQSEGDMTRIEIIMYEGLRFFSKKDAKLEHLASVVRGTKA